MAGKARRSWWSDFADVVGWELGLFREVPLLIIAAFILVLIPTFYTGTYVYSIWDPEENVDQLPVGLVILDEGVVYNDKSYNLGEDLLEELTGEQVFDFSLYETEDEAIAAVRSGDTYFCLVVPADFSAKTLPGQVQGKLKFFVSGGRSYVGKEIARQAAREIVDSLNTQIETERWKVVLESQKEAYDGAARLRDGSRDALSGSWQIENGLGKAHKGSKKINAGQKKLAEGIDSIDTERLVSAGEQLHGGTTKLAGGLAKNPVMPVLIGVSSKDLKKLAAGATEYQEKIVQLGAGIDQASDGADQLADKTGELVTGLGQLNNGSEELSDGLEQIHEGLSEFADALQPGEEKPEVLAASVAYDMADVVEARNNGEAFTPYFMGLSLWVGVLGVGFLFHVIVFPQSLAGRRRLAKILGKWATPSLISSVAAITLGLFVQYVLDTPVVHIFGYYAILLMAVLTYNAIILSVNSLIGDAGKLAALIFLVVQISSVEGAYPLATGPWFYQAISPYMPMTHVVFGLRAAMFEAFDGDWIGHAIDMLPWFFISIGIALVAARRFNYVDDEDYGPALDLSFMNRN